MKKRHISLHRGASWLAATALLGLAVAPAQARVSLDDLQAQLQALQNQVDTMVATPCPPGQGVTGIAADGTLACANFAIETATFSFDFVQGTPGIPAAVNDACPLWQDFIATTADGGYGLLTVTGSAGAPRTCSDPAKVDEILAAMAAAAAGPTVGGNSAVVNCDGFNWSISNFCASTANGAPGAPQAELKVSPEGDPVPTACACQGAGDGVYVVRPCIGNQNWGGVGTEVCNAPAQTIEVTAQ